MQPTIQSPLAPQAQQYGTTAESDVNNNPQIQAAGANVASLQEQAGQSQAAEQSLPVMLQQALSGSVGSSDADIQKSKSDLGQYLGDLGNPQGMTDSAASQIPGAVLAPSQQRDIVASRLGNEAANLSSDNLVMGLRLGGIANIIHSAAAAQASNTQNLLAKLDRAQTTYQQLFDQAKTHADFAMHLADLAQNADQFNKNLSIQQQQTNIQQQSLQANIAGNPVIQGAKTIAQAKNDAKKMNLQDFYNAYAGNQFLSATQASAIWNAAHPGQTVNFSILGNANAATGGVSSVLNLLNGGNQNRPPLSSFDH